MNLSLKWLADYVDCGVSVKEFCAGMTMSGSKVETYETEGEVVKNVIVGKACVHYAPRKFRSLTGVSGSMSAATLRSRS